MAAVLARSSAPVAVSYRRSQSQKQQKRSGVAAAAWQKAITEAELEQAEVRSKFFLCLPFSPVKADRFRDPWTTVKKSWRADSSDGIKGSKAIVKRMARERFDSSSNSYLFSSNSASTSTSKTKKKSTNQQGQRAVCEVAGDKVLVAKVPDGKVFAVSNKCSHLGLSLVGKTALLQGKVGEVNGKQCITCPAHGTAFSLEDGSVQGEWCPKLPNLPLIGKGPKEAPLKTFKSRVEGGVVEVDK